MKKTKYTEEQIAFALRQEEAGTPVADIIRKLGVSEATGNRVRDSALNSSISRAATALNSTLIASPDSSCSPSTRIVIGRWSHCPSWTLLKRGSLPGRGTVRPSGNVLSQPAMWS